MSLRNGNSMQTFSGRSYWPLDPRPDEVFIVDIAHALSQMCRYNGHCQRFYSVAEHSIHVSFMVPVEHALAALLHDASEAYCVDVPRPLKPFLTTYKDIELKNWLAIAQRFGLAPELPESVHVADNDILSTEHDTLMPSTPHLRGSQRREGVSLMLCEPVDAERAFLARFQELYCA
jgi:hypothetical protein